MSDNKSSLDTHMDKGLYGTPQINPDEQRKFLGTFRERVYATMTVAELRQDGYLAEWQQEMHDHPVATLLLNGNLDVDAFTPYIKLAKQFNIPFSLKTEERFGTESDAVAIELVNASAVNITELDIATHREAAKPVAVAAPAKKSLWQRLFNSHKQ
ncbi:YueI family protein [Periweissella cryptocerci]|nr:YueI family protein [Periweissella cryptocerci]